MKYYGYMGSMLFIDLTTEKIVEEVLPLALVDGFGGGLGINVKLMWDRFTPGTPALAPGNMIVIGAGPLVNSGVPSTPKTVLTTKGALSGTLLSSPTGEFGHMLKKAGYDHVVIQGRAARPVYIEMSDTRVRLHPAEDLWGKDIYETTDELMHRHGRCSVAAIGPAGENGVMFANVLVNKQSTWCRGGIGAVWGSKNLKALVASGNKKPAVFHPKRLQEAVRNWYKIFNSSPFLARWRELGIYIAWDSWLETGKLSVKNWTTLYPSDKATELYGPQAYLSQIRKGSYSCPSCPLGCKGILGTGTEFEAVSIRSTDPFAGSAAFGVRCDVGSLERVVKCTEVSNRLGMDYATLTARLEYLIDLYEKGVISQADCEGFRPRTGFEATMELMDLIAWKKGIGLPLAGTWEQVTRGIGKGNAQLAVHIKGIDPSSDLRTHLCVETLGLLTGTSGGHNMRALGITIVPGRSADSLVRFGRRIGIPEESIPSVFSGPRNYNPARLLKWVEDYNTVLLILGACNREPLARAFDINNCVEFFTAVTGKDISREELLQMGAGTWDIERMFNFREGLSRNDDMPPLKWAVESRKFHDDSVLPPFTYDQATALLEEYYDERGWDVTVGGPRSQR